MWPSRHPHISPLPTSPASSLPCPTPPFLPILDEMNIFWSLALKYLGPQGCFIHSIFCLDCMQNSVYQLFPPEFWYHFHRKGFLFPPFVDNLRALHTSSFQHLEFYRLIYFTSEMNDWVFSRNKLHKDGGSVGAYHYVLRPDT